MGGADFCCRVLNGRCRKDRNCNWLENRLVLNFLRKKKDRKVLVIGLDCAEPSLVFDKWGDELPTLRYLMAHGAYGLLTSSIPCITVPAWSSMLSGKDPGVLGFYGFRNRADYSYDNMSIASGAAVKEKRVWEYLGEGGKQSIVVGVPQTYPVKPINGYLISSFLTPSVQKQYTHPHELRYEIDRVLEGREYDVDVRNYRTEDKDNLLKQIYEMTEKRFQVLNYLIREKQWDFFMSVEMGVDRIHHGFWKYHDAEHHKYEPNNKYEHTIKQYYQYIDQEIAKLLEAVDDNTVVLVISDHGAKRMDGGFCLNQWLYQEGYLVFKDYLTTGQLLSFDKLTVDWEKTTAWGAGGYYGRLWLNVQGREPQGRIPKEDYDKVCKEISEKLGSMADPTGQALPTICYRPEEIYRVVRNVPSDLIIYFGNLHWRSVGSLGHQSIYTFENDTGPDDANHSQDGLVIYYDPKQRLNGKQLNGLQLMDIAPTILHLMEQPVPDDMQGKIIPVS
jgi:predicted AlkP superfamily phosphohydrolase/phosphomutase